MTKPQRRSAHEREQRRYPSGGVNTCHGNEAKIHVVHGAGGQRDGYIADTLENYQHKECAMANEKDD